MGRRFEPVWAHFRKLSHFSTLGLTFNWLRTSATLVGASTTYFGTIPILSRRTDKSITLIQFRLAGSLIDFSNCKIGTE